MKTVAVKMAVSSHFHSTGTAAQQLHWGSVMAAQEHRYSTATTPKQQQLQQHNSSKIAD